eukprot:sb/3466734/
MSRGRGSTPREVTIGVPQGSILGGSILGPILFIMYTKELEQIVQIHGMKLHLYADDSQLYCSFKNADLAATEEKINKCLLDIQKWMAKNRLMLNSGKTAVMVVKSAYDREPSPTKLTVFGIPTDTVESARNLGVFFDEKLTMEKHVSHVVRGCMGYLTNLWRIGDMLNWQSKIRMVNVFIHSKLDFYYRRSKIQLQGIYSDGRSEEELRLSGDGYIFCQLKLGFILMHQVVHGYAPDYLTNEIQKRRQKSINLRANNDKILLEEKIHGDLKLRHKITERGISIAGPVIWNNLPRKIRQLENVGLFKKQLKTYLFVNYYGGSYSVI